MEISPDRWQQVKDLYEAASECAPTQRADFLAKNGSDETVTKEVLRLLAEEDHVGEFLSTPPFVDYRLPVQQEKRQEEAKKAMDLGENLSRENRLMIEAQYRNSIHDSAHEAEIYKSLFTFYPDNLEYGLSLAKSQCFSAQWQQANSTLDDLQQHKSPDGDDPRIDFVRSAVSVATGDYKKAQTLAERIELRAQQRGARRLAAQALQIQCNVLSRLGDPSKAMAACDKSKSIFSDIGDHRPPRRLRATLRAQCSPALRRSADAISANHRVAAGYAACGNPGLPVCA
jgi:hypothetical protein